MTTHSVLQYNETEFRAGTHNQTPNSGSEFCPLLTLPRTNFPTPPVNPIQVTLFVLFLPRFLLTYIFLLFYFCVILLMEPCAPCIRNLSM